AKQQDQRLVGGEAQRRQEVALQQGVALPRRRDDGHAGLAQRLDVAVDRALANLEGGRQVLGALFAARLKLKDDREQTIGAVHVSSFHPGSPAPTERLAPTKSAALPLPVQREIPSMVTRPVRVSIASAMRLNWRIVVKETSDWRQSKNGRIASMAFVVPPL